MAQDNIDNSQVSIHLGKTSAYKSQYDKSLLVREKRSNNRKHLGIENDNLPFVGYDTWNAYEVSALTDNGLPVVGIAKIIYPCSSRYIVESKSLKLYFNSFNMTKLGNDAEAVLTEVNKRSTQDLSELLECDVQILLDSPVYGSSNELYEYMMYYDEITGTSLNYVTLEDQNNISISIYQETPEILKIEQSDGKMRFLHSGLLKSNCRVTQQPDHGDVFIRYRGKQQVTDQSLLEYIVSFRDECHFHEEICETLYKRLWDIGCFDELGVMCLYTRRGGIDLNPERASHVHLLHSTLSNSTFTHVKTPRQ